MRFLLIVTIVVLVVSAGCKPSPGKVSVNVDSLATVYAELLVLNERYSISKDTLSAQQYETDYTDVLRRHNYSRERFSRELETVSRSPDAFRQMCDRAFTVFQEMRRKPPEKQGHP